MMKITVLLFAYLKEQVGEPLICLELESGASLFQLKEALENRYPVLKTALAGCRFAINQTYTNDWEQILKEQDEVALIPPVSGG